MKGRNTWADKLADITPFWRTLKAGGQLNAEYPGGLGAVRGRLEGEGHRVFAKGRRVFVADLERVLLRPGFRKSRVALG